MEIEFSNEPVRLLSEVIVEVFDEHGPDLREEHLISLQFRIWKEAGINLKPETLAEWHKRYFRKIASGVFP